MPPFAIIGHKTKDRVRIKFPEKRGDDSFFRETISKVREVDGVIRATFNSTTGSVLLIVGTQPDEVVDKLLEMEVFDTTAPDYKKSTNNPTELVGYYISALNNKVKGSTGGDLGVGDVAFATLFFNGLYQFLKRDFVMPPWYTSLWYAYGLFTKIGSKGKK